MLVGCGHDLNHLLNNYTLEQIEIMAMSIFQHKMTQLKVISYAMGGDAARDRVPGAPGRSGRTQTPEAEEKARELAISQLLGLQKMVGDSGGIPAPPSNWKRSAPADAALKKALDDLPDPGGQ